LSKQDFPMQTLTVKAREPAQAERNGSSRGEQGLADIVKSTASDVVHLATAELRLAKLELTESIRSQAGRVALLAAGLVPLLVAYLLGVVALVAWVRPLFGTAGALAAVALSQAALGGVIATIASPRLGAKSWREQKEPQAAAGAGTEGTGA
jgi:uncharacterized membrane protein YqjE